MRETREDTRVTNKPLQKATQKSTVRQTDNGPPLTSIADVSKYLSKPKIQRTIYLQIVQL